MAETAQPARDRVGRGRERDLYRRVALGAHVAFLVAFLVAIAVSGGVTAPVVALGIGMLVFAAWALWILGSENAIRLRELQTNAPRRPLQHGFADERPPGPPPAVSMPGNPIRPPMADGP